MGKDPHQIAPVVGRDAEFGVVPHDGGEALQHRRTETKRRLWWRVLGQGSGNSKNTREREASARRSIRMRASSRHSRTLSSLASTSPRTIRTTPRYIRLAADQPDLAVGRRLGQQVFARAEPDFEPDLAHRTREQRLRIDRAPRVVERDFQPGRDIVEQDLLGGAQLPPAPPSVEDAPGLFGRQGSLGPR